MLSLAQRMLLGAVVAPFTTALVVPDGVGKLPALGWNSWNAYGCNVSECKILAAAQYMVSLGLKDAGYEYVNIDDCWSVQAGRDNVTQRLVPDPTKFPDGINGTAAQVHALGLKLGIYSSAGTQTCAGYPASLGYETIDAETWADWGVDYLKYDNCNVPANWTDSCEGCVPDSSSVDYINGTCTGLSGDYCPAGYNYTASLTAERYRLMRDALNATGRPFLYSLCDWGDAGVQEWGAETGNSWRATGDIQPNWARILTILNENSFYLNNVNFYGHSDPDMLEVGNGDLTPSETRSHFAFWAAMKGPLLIGTDLASINATGLAVLTNPTLLAFNQDPLIGTPATPYKWGTNPDWTFNASFPAEFWSGTFHNATTQTQQTLVIVLNVYNETQARTVSWAEVPQLADSGAKTKTTSFSVTDGWTGAVLGCFQDSVTVDVDSHDTALLVVDGECGKY